MTSTALSPTAIFALMTSLHGKVAPWGTHCGAPCYGRTLVGLDGWTFTVAKEYLIRSSHVDSVYSPARKKGMKKPVDKGLPKSNIYIIMYCII